MDKYMVLDICNGRIIADTAYLADSFWPRLKGLLGKKRLPDNEALIIYPCSRIHTMGMKMDIDVLFVDTNGRIIYLIKNISPGQVSPLVKEARYVVELPAGKIAESRIAVGHNLFIGRCE